MNKKRLADLLLRWEEEQEQGREVSPEDLCRNDADLIEAVRQGIKALRKVSWLAGPADEEKTEKTTAAGSNRPSAGPLPRLLAGRYRLHEVIDEKDETQIWLGFDLKSEQDVVIKVARHTQPTGPEQVKEFLEAAELVIKLQHSAIVPVHDAGFFKGGRFIVADLLEADDLARHLGTAQDMTAELREILARSEHLPNPAAPDPPIVTSGPGQSGLAHGTDPEPRVRPQGGAEPRVLPEKPNQAVVREGRSVDVESLLRRLGDGDEAARDQLIGHARKHLRRLTSRMLKEYPAVARWVEVDDVLQDTLLWLTRALEAAKPESEGSFYLLAARQVRRTLAIHARQHRKANAPATKYRTAERPVTADEAGGPLDGIADQHSGEPPALAEWAEFHELVKALPQEERHMVELVWYQGLSQEKVAAVLGVSVRTVQRRWHAARAFLQKRLEG
jgi:RNA polymerase sigma factor (sigma-70 family)